MQHKWTLHLVVAHKNYFATEAGWIDLDIE